MITERDLEILKVIQDYKEAHGYAPSIRDISNLCFISVPTVKKHLWKLCENGYIEMTPKISRSIVIKITV